MPEHIIHQIWFQGWNAIPTKYFEGIESWKKTNPSYKYMFWDEITLGDFIKNHYSGFYDNWINLDRVIKKCDSARYLLLHHFGGVYVDLDTYAYQGINDLIHKLNLYKYDILFSEESKEPQSWKSELSKQILDENKFDFILANAILMSRKEQPFWLDFLNRAFEVKNETVLDSFSTWHLTRYFEEYRDTKKYKVIPYNYLLGSRYVGQDTFAVHSYDATWFDYRKTFPWHG